MLYQPPLVRLEGQFLEARRRMRVASGAIWALNPRPHRKHRKRGPSDGPNQARLSVAAPGGGGDASEEGSVASALEVGSSRFALVGHHATNLALMPEGLTPAAAASMNNLSYGPMHLLNGSLHALFSRSVRRTPPLKAR